MSDGRDPNQPGYTDEPADAGLWARYLAAATWVKVAIPAVVVALAVGIGVLLAQGGDSSTSTADQETEDLLRQIAVLLAAKEAGATTTVETSVVEVTTTEAVDTTEVEESTTTEVATTTAAATTTEAPTTPSTPPATTSPPPVITTLPPVTEPDTTTDTTPPPDSAEDEPDVTETPDSPETEPDVTESPDSPATDPPLGPGALAASRDEVQTTWNGIAEGTDVPTIAAWSPLDLPGETASVADLGGNIRLVALTEGASGPVTRLVLVWLPLDDADQQAQQNTIYRDAFAVLMSTVNGGVTAQQQASVADQLGLNADLPPAEDGTSAEATLQPQQYALQALDVSGVPGVDTLISVTSAALR